jgi:hypothetical protein
VNGRDRDQLTVPPDGKPEADQPRWRQDFPIDWLQDEYIARRDFTKFMVLTSFAFAVGQLWILAQSYFRRSRRALPAREIAAVNDIPVGFHGFSIIRASTSRRCWCGWMSRGLSLTIKGARTWYAR